MSVMLPKTHYGRFLSWLVIFTCILVAIREIFFPTALIFRTRTDETLNKEQQFCTCNNKSRVQFKLPEVDTLDELKMEGYITILKSGKTGTSPPGSRPIKAGGNNIKENAKTSPFIVPNVVHYVWLGTDLAFTLIQYLSFLSVSRHIKPDYIFVHGEVGPSGTWWSKTVNEINNIYHVHGVAPKKAYSGKRFLFPAHESDLLRMEIVYNLPMGVGLYGLSEPQVNSMLICLVLALCPLAILKINNPNNNLKMMKIIENIEPFFWPEYLYMCFVVIENKKFSMAMLQVPEFGGIYLDADVIVLKSFDPLRRFNTTMGREVSNGICNGIIISRKSAPFIRLLLDQYQSYNIRTTEQWGFRSVEVPHRLEQIFPSWIHVEETTLNQPAWRNMTLIFDKVWDWSKNYAVHTWVRMRKRFGGSVPQSIKDINCGNSTIAEIGRLALYGSAIKRCK